MANVKNLFTVGNVDILEVDADPSAGIPALLGSLAVLSQGVYGAWQKVGPLDGDWKKLNPGMKSGQVQPNQWSGNPKKFAVVFTTPFPVGSDYSIEIGSSSDQRTWTWESKTVSGFTINANAFSGITGQVTWSAFLLEETS